MVIVFELYKHITSHRSVLVLQHSDRFLKNGLINEAGRIDHTTGLVHGYAFGHENRFC